jgi:hypothetical protein
MCITVAENMNIGHYPEWLKCEECCVFGRNGCNFVENFQRFGGTMAASIFKHLYQNTRRHIPENSILYCHGFENLMSHS